jgi:hypothetical protein
MKATSRPVPPEVHTAGYVAAAHSESVLCALTLRVPCNMQIVAHLCFALDNQSALAAYMALHAEHKISVGAHRIRTMSSLRSRRVDRFRDQP